MAARPSGPGSYVQVLFDYEYTANDGTTISIREGEQYLLLKKSNDEWWRVIQGDKKPIYVPANYVEEVPKQRPKLQKQDSVDSTENKENVGEKDDVQKTENGLDAPIPPGSESADEDEETHVENPENTVKRFSTFGVPLKTSEKNSEEKDLDSSQDSVFEEPKYENLSTLQRNIKKKAESLQPQDTEQHTYANIGSLGIPGKAKSLPPKPKDGAKPEKILESCWEVHKDEETRRIYYYNTATQETTWKPPRGLRLKESASTSVTVPDIKPKINTSKRHSMPVIPRGYSEEKSESGETVYINDATEEKWKSSVDDTGRSYFYKEDGGKSVWTLPETPNNVDDKSEKTVTDDDELPPPPPPPVSKPEVLRFPERRGSVNKTKITENGKKVKKNWSQCFAVTRGNHLYFYKNEKATLPKPNFPNGRADTEIDLRGAKVEFGAKDKSSKENVILLTVLGGTQFLVQVDDPIKIHEWYQTLSQVLFQLNPGSGLMGESNGSLDDSMESDRGLPGQELVEDQTSSPSPTSTSRFRKRSKKSNTLEKNATLDDPNLSAPEKANRIRDRLKNFFLKRPGIEMLQEKGIYKDAVFGAHIQKLCEKEKSNMPRFVSNCIAAIEKRGLDMDGLYRVSGNLAQIQKLRFQVDQNEQYNLDDPDWDIHVLTGALKLFFRELKEPLFTFHLFDKFQNCIKINEKASRLKAFKENIKALPKINKETTKELFKHLCRVIEHSHENRMQAQNIAIVFGPTLLWPEKPCENVAVTMVLQGQIVEYILHEYKHLF